MTDDETFRTFFMRRQWLHGDEGPLSREEYAAFMDRRAVLTIERRAYLEAFMHGYLRARPQPPSVRDWPPYRDEEDR